jgi:hypothetical protein
MDIDNRCSTRDIHEHFNENRLCSSHVERTEHVSDLARRHEAAAQRKRWQRDFLLSCCCSSRVVFFLSFGKRTTDSLVNVDWCLSPIGCNHRKLSLFFLFLVVFFSSSVSLARSLPLFLPSLVCLSLVSRRASRHNIPQAQQIEK